MTLYLPGHCGFKAADPSFAVDARSHYIRYVAVSGDQGGITPSIYRLPLTNCALRSTYGTGRYVKYDRSTRWRSASLCPGKSWLTRSCGSQLVLHRPNFPSTFSLSLKVPRPRLSPVDTHHSQQPASGTSAGADSGRTLAEEATRPAIKGSTIFNCHPSPLTSRDSHVCSRQGPLRTAASTQLESRRHVVA